MIFRKIRPHYYSQYKGLWLVEWESVQQVCLLAQGHLYPPDPDALDRIPLIICRLH